jgi:SAM-dependent methyltransferase
VRPTVCLTPDVGFAHTSGGDGREPTSLGIVAEHGSQKERPRYGTWVRIRRVWVFVSLTAACAAASLLGLWSAWFWALLIPALLFGYISVILILTVRRFGQGGVQQRIHALLAEEIAGQSGSVLDVGCGSGSLAVTIARADPESTVLGVDSWGDNWEYSQSQCEANARIESVADRVEFMRASAADLPFADASFDAVTSCLTFHEVHESADRTDAMAESLRVLRPGGRFAFLDLFDDPGPFTSTDHVLDVVSQAGCAVVRNEPLRDLMPLPFPLNGAKVLGHARLIAGRRR